MRLTTPSKESRIWPRFMLWGKVRTSTVVLMVAFAGFWWIYENYRPTNDAPPPATQVVPPGFIPDPSYTWVPRTDVQSNPTSTAPTITSETTSPELTTSPAPTSSETSSSSPTSPTSPTTTPSSASPAPATSTTAAPPSTPTAPTVMPSVVPGVGPRSTPALPSQ